jgi:hypothetical protein
MSRLHIAFVALLVSGIPAFAADSLTDEEISAQIEKQRRLVAVDSEGCVKYPVGDEIVVCGSDAERQRQKIERGPTDEDRIRRGEAVSTKRAAACISGDSSCRIALKGIGVGFGYVPPVAIPLAEVLKGLPEPEMVVPEGGPEAP